MYMEAMHMGLLFHDLSKAMHEVSEYVYKRQFEVDDQLASEYDEYRRRKMYEDILHNLSFLDAAISLEDEQLFLSYVEWLYTLMVNLMPDTTPTRIKEQLITHYELLIEGLDKFLEPKTQALAKSILTAAIERTKVYEIPKKVSTFEEGKYGWARKQYLTYLRENDKNRAIQFVEELADNSFTLDEVYVDVLQPVMEEIGHLWHENKISVNQEHYMTSVTQLALSQFYKRIFDTPRINYSILVCSVGSELHEMGARMVSDLFEYHGYDSVYLGAGVPIKALMESIESYKPNIIALSVTMPQHLKTCKEYVIKIRQQYPEILIAVGGRAFSISKDIVNEWPIDTSLKDAKQFLNWAEQTLGA